jgi:hypothetical protein
MEENHVDINPIVADDHCEFCVAYYQLDEDFKSRIMLFMIQCKVMQDSRNNNKKFED